MNIACMVSSIDNGISITGTGSPDADLSPEELRPIVDEALRPVNAGARVLAIIPDKTRDDNTHILFPMAAAALARIGVIKLDALVAQGTHSPMYDAEKLAKIGGENKDSIPNPRHHLRPSMGPARRPCSDRRTLG